MEFTVKISDSSLLELNSRALELEEFQMFRHFMLLTFTGRQTTINKRSVVAKLARNVLVGDLKEFHLMMVTMMRRFPVTPKQNMRLQENNY